MVRLLPWILPAANAVIALPLIAVAITYTVSHRQEDLSGLVLLLLLLDFPASLVAQAWTELLGQYYKVLDSDVAGVLVFSVLYLATGFAWYYLLGRALRKLIRWRRERHSRRGFPV